MAEEFCLFLPKEEEEEEENSDNTSLLCSKPEENIPSNLQGVVVVVFREYRSDVSAFREIYTIPSSSYIRLT